MSEMVDRVAKALVDSMRAQDGPFIDLKLVARAAIEAMREPTEAMLDSLDMANSGWGTREHSKELWQELIDVALK